MPLKAPSTPPGKKIAQKIQTQRNLKGQQRKVKTKSSSPSTLARNYDEELRAYLAATSQEIPAIEDASVELLGSSLNLPFSKDFGSFDLTICETGDKKCVVLVKYERRVFINGTQVYIRNDGLICDIHGAHDPVLQKCYDQASKARRRLRKMSTSTLTTSDDATGDVQKRLSALTTGGETENRRRSTKSVSAAEDGDAECDGTADGEQDCQWTLPVYNVMKKSKNSVEAEIHDLEKEFNKIIHALCTMILEVADHETTDTESAHSEGDSSPDNRQLIQEAIRRFSYQFQSVLELSNHLREEIAGMDDEGEGDNESSDISSVASVSSVIAMYREPYPPTGSTPIWIHDEKSWRNEKARLHAELAAARSEQRRMKRQHEELHARINEVKLDRNELRELLAEFEEENSKLKQRSRGEPTGFAPMDELVIDQPQYKQTNDHGMSLNSAFVEASKKMKMKGTTNDIATGKRQHGSKLLKTEMKRLRHVADDMEEDFEKIMQENVSLRVRANQVERDRKDLKEKVRLAEILCNETKSDLVCLDKKNAELENKCATLLLEKEKSEMEIARTNNLLVEVRSRNRAVERDAGELERTVKMLETEKEQQREELDKLERAKIECNNKAVKLTKENAELQSTLLQLKRDKANLEIEIRMLREEHEANCAVRKQAEEARKLALGELKDLRRAHAEMSEQISNLKDTAANADICCQTLKKKNEELVDKTQDLEDQNESLETRTRSLSNTGRLLEVENSELKHMVRRLRSDNADMKSHIATLSQANADFRAKVEQWNRENASAEGKMRNLLRAKGYLENIVSQMTLLGTDAKSQFERLDTECAGLQEQQQRSKTHLVDGATTDAAYDTDDVLPSMAIDLRSLDDVPDDEGNGRAMISSPVPH